MHGEGCNTLISPSYAHSPHPHHGHGHSQGHACNHVRAATLHCAHQKQQQQQQQQGQPATAAATSQVVGIYMMEAGIIFHSGGWVGGRVGGRQ